MDQPVVFLPAPQETAGLWDGLFYWTCASKVLSSTLIVFGSPPVARAVMRKISRLIWPAPEPLAPVAPDSCWGPEPGGRTRPRSSTIYRGFSANLSSPVVKLMLPSLPRYSSLPAVIQPGLVRKFTALVTGLSGSKM